MPLKQLILFDPTGGVRYIEESVKTRDQKNTEALLFLGNFDTTSLGELNPLTIDREAPGRGVDV